MAVRGRDLSARIGSVVVHLRQEAGSRLGSARPAWPTGTPDTKLAVKLLSRAFRWRPRSSRALRVLALAGFAVEVLDPADLHVIDAVRTRDRPSSQAGNLQSGVYPAPVADPDMLVHWGSQNAQRRGADCPAA